MLNAGEHQILQLVDYSVGIILLTGSYHEDSLVDVAENNVHTIHDTIYGSN